METFFALLASTRHRSPVNSPHKGQWRGALMFSLICPWTNRWVNNPNADDLRRYHAHYDVSVIYRSPPRQFLIIATIITQLISRLFNRHESTKYGLSATFFDFSISFYSIPNLNINTRTHPQTNLIAFLFIYSRICACKVSLHKQTFHMYWNFWVSGSFSCINRAD